MRCGMLLCRLKVGYVLLERHLICLRHSCLGAQVSQTEKRELTGNVTLKAIQQMAEAMGYRFVYAIVPKDSIDEVIADRAKEKATAIVNQTSQHMALESQTLSKEQLQFEIERLQKNLMDEMPTSLWNDE